MEPRVSYRAPGSGGKRECGAVLWLVVAGVVFSLLYGLISSPRATAELGGLLLVSFAGVGKLLPLWSLSGQSSFGPYQLGLTVWASEVCIVLLVVHGAETLNRFGVFRRGLASVQHKAARMLGAYPSMQRATLFAVAFFVLLPLPGTGALVGSFIGVLLDVRRRTLVATVAVGSFLGSMGVAFAVVHCGDAVTRLAAARGEPTILYPVLATGLALACAAGYWLTRAHRRTANAVSSSASCTSRRA